MTTRGFSFLQGETFMEERFFSPKVLDFLAQFEHNRVKRVVSGNRTRDLFHPKEESYP